MNIHFTRHAEAKFAILRRHGIQISQEQVQQTLMNPEAINESKLPLIIAQRSLDAAQVLRTVYREENNIKIVITFYPDYKKRNDTDTTES